MDSLKKSNRTFLWCIRNSYDLLLARDYLNDATCDLLTVKFEMCFFKTSGSDRCFEKVACRKITVFINKSEVLHFVSPGY